MLYTALSVRQPWASLIASGSKTIEMRTWATKFRGPLLICASARKCGDLPVGVALCLCDLLDVRPFKPGDVAAAGIAPEDRHCWRRKADCEGTFAWVLGPRRSVRQTAVKGKLHLFKVQIRK